MSEAPLLSVQISAAYSGRSRVLNGLSLEIEPGEILGLVGQSGCGKSTLALAILGLLHLKRGQAQGTIAFGGRNLLTLREKEMRSIRGKNIALVPQSPISSLNPTLRIRTQMEEACRAHDSGPAREWERKIMEALNSVGLATHSELLEKYPSQLSVGQAQRLLIAMAILHRPALLIADEPTSALDVITQSEILRLFSTLNEQLGMGILYISHDLLSVSSISHRVAVMSEGRIVECSRSKELFSRPAHPYTKSLIGATVDFDVHQRSTAAHGKSCRNSDRGRPSFRAQQPPPFTLESAGE